MASGATDQELTLATILTDQQVEFRPGEVDKLAWLPWEDDDLVVAVHEGALRAGDANRLTQVVQFDEDYQVSWVAALDEAMLEPVNGLRRGSRLALANCLLRGRHLWQVVWPGSLLASGTRPPCGTIYDGATRPWVVLGELADQSVVAAPLGDAAHNPKWWTPLLRAEDVPIRGSKPAQLELAHLWSFPGVGLQGIAVAASARDALTQAVRRYFDIG